MRFRAVIVAAFSVLLGAVPAAHAAVYRPLPGLDAFYAAQASAHPDLVTRTVYGTSGAGRPLVAYRVGRGDRAKPAALYVAAQHGRDWLSAEVERRLFAYAVAHPELLVRTDLWFVPVANPDGYDRSFASDRQFATTLSGVDTVRNWPDHWG